MACSKYNYGLIASLAAIIIGILQLALERSVLSQFQHRLATHSTAWPPPQAHPIDVRPLALVPTHLNTTPTKLIVACGALGLVAGIVNLFRAANSPADNETNRKIYNDSRSRRPYLTLALTTITTLLSLASFIYTTVAESASSIFLYTDFISNYQSFTREAWTCQLATHYPDDAWSALAGTCWEARIGRWLLVPLIAALGCLCWRIFADVAASRTKHKRRMTMELAPFTSSSVRKPPSEDDDEGA